MSPLASYVVQTVVTLLAVIALAVLALYAARRVGIGRPLGPLQLIGRLPLDGRRAVYLVRVGETVYVLGASEAGLRKLGEVAKDALDFDEGAPERSFFEVLSTVLRRSEQQGEKDRDGT
jgi:flagellar biogenesis protein FliO